MLIVMCVVLVIFAAWFVSCYNHLVRLRNQLERAWSNIDVILKQRFEEIPQLIQVIEQFAQFEAGVIQALVDARTRYGTSHTPAEKIKASQGLSLALQGVISIGENYPQLKTNENFIQLQERVSALENAISDRRETYNDAVASFNTRIEQFPDAFAASFLNYQRQVLFEATPEERKKVSLKMDLPKFGRGA